MLVIEIWSLNDRENFCTIQYNPWMLRTNLEQKVLIKINLWMIEQGGVKYSNGWIVPEQLVTLFLLQFGDQIRYYNRES